MNRDQMELLERLARLRELRALSGDEFEREKEEILYPNASASALVVLPGVTGKPSQTLPAVRRASPPRRKGRVIERPVGLVIGWAVWILLSVGGLYALDDGSTLLALALLGSGLMFAPPLQRLLATRCGTPVRAAVTILAVYMLMGLVEPQAAGRGSAASAAAACGTVVTENFAARGRLMTEAVARPWLQVWDDVIWARGAGYAAYEQWLDGDELPQTAAG